MSKKSQNPMQYKVIIAEKGKVIGVRYFRSLKSAKEFVVSNNNAEQRISAKIIDQRTGKSVLVGTIVKEAPVYRYKVIVDDNKIVKHYKLYESALLFYNQAVKDNVNKVVFIDRLKDEIVKIYNKESEEKIITIKKDCECNSTLFEEAAGKDIVPEKKPNFFKRFFNKFKRK